MSPSQPEPPSDANAEPPPQRVAPITFPREEPVLARPGEQDAQSVRDAFRETSFALRPDLDWLLAALRMQRRIVENSYPSKFRNQRYASALLLWSRIYATGVELISLTARASYVAGPPLIRASLEWLGAEQAVVGSEQADYEAWLREAFEPSRVFAATDVGMGQYMAGQQVAQSEELGTIYRAASELARPHFGASAMLAAPESNRQRIALNWGDQTFHFGWAQLLFGWQIAVQDRQLRFAIGRDLFAVEADDREEYHALHRRAGALLGAADRCRAEWVEQEGRARLLLHQFRRQPGGAPKQILL